ncbi:MAG: FoF1 ATP synthase subunit a [Oscillospiraceae bacterium]
MNGPKIIFEIPVLGGIPITQTIISSWAVMALLILASIWLTHDLKINPSRKQVLLEKAYTMFYDLVEGTMGKHNLKYAPYIGTLLLSSVFGSLIGMTYVFRSVTADLSTTMAWALATFVLIQGSNIYNNGVLGWLKGFTEPVVVMTPMNLVSEIATPISMSFRHFGNIAGGMVMTSLLYGALASFSAMILQFIPIDFINSIPIFQVGIPAIVSIYFDLFSGCVQALIFCMLTMVFVSNVSPEPEKA